jgi:hypothetical protein
MKEKLLELAEQFSNEAKGYHEMAKSGQPTNLWPHWEGVACGLERAATVLTAEAWTNTGE